MRRQPDVREAFAVLLKVTVAVFGIGAWEPELSTVHDSIGDDERSALTAAGVAAEGRRHLPRQRWSTCSQRPVRADPAPRSDRAAAHPHPVGVVLDARKAQAVRTAIRGKVINNLITHRALVEEMLAFTGR